MTPTQLRMARAALDLTTRQLGAAVGLSAMAISRYERGNTGVLSGDTVARLVQYFEAQRVFCGPKDSVCVEVNVFTSERWLGLACYQLLLEGGKRPSSGDLLDAYDRLVCQIPPDMERPDAK